MKQTNLFLGTYTSRLITNLGCNNMEALTNEIWAGVSAVMVSLPLGLGFANTMGISPLYVIAATALGCLLFSLLSNLQVLMAGPSVAVVVVGTMVVGRFGAAGLLGCTLLSAIVMIGIGFGGLGVGIKKLPASVISGLNFGVAVLLGVHQLRFFIHLQNAADVRAPLSILGEIISGQVNVDVYAVGVGIVTALVIVLGSWCFPKVPVLVLAIVVSSYIAYIFGWPIELVGLDHSAGFNGDFTPVLTNEFAMFLIPAVLALACLSAIDCCKTATTVGRFLQCRCNVDRELINAGASNIIVGIGCGVPVSGNIRRTIDAVKLGATTQLAALVHGVLLVVMFTGGVSVIGHIPKSVLSVVLLCFVARMSCWKDAYNAVKSNWYNAIIFTIVFSCCIVNLFAGVQIALILSALMLINQNDNTLERFAKDERTASLGNQSEYASVKIEKRIRLVDAAGKNPTETIGRIEQLWQTIDELPAVVILRLGLSAVIDSLCSQKLENFISYLKLTGREAIIYDIQYQHDLYLLRSGIYKKLKRQNIKPTLEAAVERARELSSSNEVKGDRNRSQSVDLNRFGRFPIIRNYSDSI